MSAPLYDVEAEARLLGGILDGGDILGAANILEPGSFYLERNQFTFDAANRLLSAGVDISPATVAAELRRTGHGDITEASLDTVRAQATDDFGAAHVTAYAQTIREFAHNRRLEQMLLRALHKIKDPTLTPEQKLDAAQHDIMTLATRQQTQEIHDGPKLACAAKERWERRRNASDGLMGLSWGLPELDRATGDYRAGIFTS